jgi:hypothetical protein
MKNAVKKEIPIFYAISITFLMFCFVSSTSASGVLYEQTDYSTSEASGVSNVYMIQYIGTDLSGTVEYISAYVRAIAGTGETSITLYECPTEVAVNSWGTCSIASGQSSDYSVVTDSPTLAEYTLPVPYELDNTKYYYILVADTPADRCGSFPWYCWGSGSTSDLYSGGSENTNTATILDYSFSLQGSGGIVYSNSISLLSPISTTTPSTNVDLYVNYFNDGLFDTLNFVGYYESDNWNTAFYSTTTAQTGLIVGDTINVDLNTNSVVLWRAYLTSTATTTSPLYSGFEKFAVVSNPYPELIGVNDWDDSFDLATTTCSISNITGCFQNAGIFLFKPSQNAFQPFIDLKEDIQYKPPFGYFFAVKEVFDDFNATTTPAYTWEIPEVLSDMLSPIKTGFGMVLWLLFGFWVFRTLSKLQT